jgi:hypothetical protein
VRINAIRGGAGRGKRNAQANPVKTNRDAKPKHQKDNKADTTYPSAGEGGREISTNTTRAFALRHGPTTLWPVNRHIKRKTRQTTKSALQRRSHRDAVVTGYLEILEFREIICLKALRGLWLIKLNSGRPRGARRRRPWLRRRRNSKRAAGRRPARAHLVRQTAASGGDKVKTKRLSKVTDAEAKQAQPEEPGTRRTTRQGANQLAQVR